MARDTRPMASERYNSCLVIDLCFTESLVAEIHVIRDNWIPLITQPTEMQIKKAESNTLIHCHYSETVYPRQS